MGKLIQNKSVLFITSLFGILIISFLSMGSSGGVTGKTKLNGSGCTCHGNNPTSTVGVTISGPAELLPGQKGIYRVTITGGPLVAAGTNIATTGGTLTPVTGSGLQKIGDELTHTSPKSPVSGAVTFDFELTAPSKPGSVTLYANGNSVNRNGSSSGDQWNFAPNFLINILTSVDDNITLKEFKLYQNYPNPFNPSTLISYSIPENGLVKLKIYDLFGREIVTLVNDFQNEGVHEIVFDAGKYNLSSGSYFYELEANGRRDVKKFVLMK